MFVEDILNNVPDVLQGFLSLSSLVIRVLRVTITISFVYKVYIA